MEPQTGVLRIYIGYIGRMERRMPQRDFDTLYEAHAKTVYWAAYGVTKDAQAAEEAVQTVFLRAFQHMDTLSSMSEAQCRSWLYRAATNSGIDQLRRNKHLVSTEDAGLYEADDAPGPEQAAISREQQRIVRCLVEELPEKYRQPILLYYFAQMDYAAMASMLGLSQGTLKSRMARGRTLLKNALEKGGAL